MYACDLPQVCVLTCTCSSCYSCSGAMLLDMIAFESFDIVSAIFGCCIHDVVNICS